MKRLYGRTNKRGATKQIGRHVRRLERAQLAAEQEELKRCSETQGIGSDDLEDILDMNLDACYQISNSRKDHLNIYSYVRENARDPAFSVCILVVQHVA